MPSCPETVLISVTFANVNGMIQPIAEIAEIAKKHGVLFHTDAVQAVGHVPIDVEKLHVDLLSMSGHKLGAPKGIGAIYIRKGTRISPLIFGGAQEKKPACGYRKYCRYRWSGQGCGAGSAKWRKQQRSRLHCVIS
ncbi:MAG: aminotransferase class V-fold PLP-dependent enzyme [Anaerotignum faecicola]